MDGEEPILLCGIERLQVNVGGAVAVALDVFVNLVLNNRPKHGAILHVDICLHSPRKKRAGGCRVALAVLCCKTLDFSFEAFWNLDGQRNKRTVEFYRVLWHVRTDGVRSLWGCCVRLGRLTTIFSEVTGGWQTHAR